MRRRDRERERGTRAGDGNMSERKGCLKEGEDGGGFRVRGKLVEYE